MRLEYDNAITPNSDGSYTINLGGRLDVLLDSNDQDFTLEFIVNSQIQGNWNAIVELIGPYNINVQNASYSSYYKLYLNKEYLMQAYTTSLATDVYYKISRVEGILTFYIELLGTSNIYSQSMTCTDNISSIYIGNWNHENRVIGYIKDVKFNEKVTYSYLNKDGLKQVWKNIKNYHETYMNGYYSKEEVDELIDNISIEGVSVKAIPLSTIEEICV